MTREEAKRYIIQHCNPDYPNGSTEWETAMNMAIEALQQPEIVRCKDCRFYTYHDNRAEPLWCCDYWVFEEPIPDGFCNFAERKEGDEE